MILASPVFAGLKSLTVEMSKQMPTQKPRNYRLCPLCERAFPQKQLAQAIKAEGRNARERIQQAILETHPDWRERDGACPKCWVSFRDIVRVQEFMNKFKWPPYEGNI